MEQTSLALKEWASTVQALERGSQILLMRKGGIEEETKHFELKSHSFYLYPTYEHQRKELIKPSYQQLVDLSLENWSSEQKNVMIKAYAEVIEDLEIQDEKQLGRLRELHMWTDEFADQRLRWKRKSPLHVLLVRVYRLDNPVEIPIEDEYLGCKSWISVPLALHSNQYTPVLSDEQFASHIRSIKEALNYS
ncbi:DUF1802 domain-containing protein [Paenibacillus sediminis]|uniref:DUF1802 family protein n=1 Tax=Paenibacillus sediminis TaxID=664909 RepID=A0ABS4H5N1_9BACL|nr:DUF1802 family protein [Paenibacillus sediminis]MBP1937844.1 hypothetical protein [Paenibacillus sediminis]